MKEPTALWKGLVEQRLGGILELPAEVGDATVVVKAVTGGYGWHDSAIHWFRLHVVSRRKRFMPCEIGGRPEFSANDAGSLTLMVTVEGGHEVVFELGRVELHELDAQPEWTGISVFFKLKTSAGEG